MYDKSHSVVIGDNTRLSNDTRLGSNVIIGNNVTVYPRVTIGDGCTVMDGAVIGRKPVLAGNISCQTETSYRQVTIGSRSVVGCNTIIYTGVRIGTNVLLGDLSTIREKCDIDDDAVIGQQVSLHRGTHIGARSRISYNCVITGIVEEDVFIAPGVNCAEDNNIYLSRFGLTSAQQASPLLRRFSMIGSGVTLLPNIEIGKGALVAGGSVVSHAVAPWSVVAGNPAQYVRNVPRKWVRRIRNHFA